MIINDMVDFLNIISALHDMCEDVSVYQKAIFDFHNV